MTLTSTQYPQRMAELRGSLLSIVVAQLCCAVFAALILDGGFILTIVSIGIIAHWIVVGIIAARRRNSMKVIDVILFKIGFLLFSVATLAVLFIREAIE